MAKVRLRATAPKKHPEYGNIVEYFLDIYYGKKHKPKRQKKKVLDKWAYSSPYTTPQKQFNRSVLRQCEAYRDRVKVQIDDGNNPFLKKVSDEKNNRTLLEQLYSVQRHRGANSSKTLQMYEATQRHLINFLKEVNFKQSFYNAEKKATDIC